MATIVTRETTQTDGTSPKGSPLTNAEVDTNFINLNDDKVEVSGAIIFQAKAAEALSKGDVVYVSGVSGNTPEVSKADADDASKMPAYGLAEDDANLNAAVNVVTFGTLYELDTSGFSAGDAVYVSTTAGSLTNSAPAGESSLIQNIGMVVRSHASAGSIKVGGAGRTNATPNLDDGNVFIGNASNQVEARALTGDDISGGTITSFASTGIDDNATSTAITIGSGGGTTFSGDVLLSEATPRLDFNDTDVTDSEFRFQYTGATMYLRARGGTSAYGDVRFQRSNDGSTFLEVFRTTTGGDFIFYDDDGSTEGMRWDASTNRVGIGISAPAKTIDMQSNAPSVRFRDTSATTTITDLLTSGTNGHLFNMILDAGNAGASTPAFLIKNYTTEIFRFTGAGRLGIGESNPDEELHIKASVPTIKLEDGDGTGINFRIFENNGQASLIAKNDTNFGNTIFRRDDGTNTYSILNLTADGDVDFYDNVGSSIGMRWDASSERLGVGNTIPASMLQVGGTTENADAYITFGKRVASTETNLPFIGQDDPDGGGHNDLGIGVRSSNGTINFYTGNVAAFTAANRRMTIATNGDVGIGTSTPDQLLDIGNHESTGNRSIRISQRTATGAQTYGGLEFFFDNSAGTTGVNAAIKYAAGPLRNDGELTFHTGASGSISERLRIDHNGNVGIGTGTSTTYDLTVVGASSLSTIGTNDAALRLRADGARSMQFYTNGNQRMFISSGGKVTIDPAGSTQSLHELSVREQDSPRITIDDIGGSDTSVNAALLLRADATNKGVIGYTGTDELYIENKTASGSVILGTADIDRLSISSGGNVELETQYAQLLFNGESGQGRINTGSGAAGGFSVTNVYGQSGINFKNSGAVEIHSSNNSGVVGSLTIDTSGNVGIGDGVPQRRLHVNSGATQVTSIFESSGTSSYIDFANSTTAQGRSRIGAEGTDTLVFKTEGAERLRILAGGGLTFNGDTAAANALDDYEEGTWTPTLNSGTAGTANGRYTKIGRQVFVSAQILDISDYTSATNVQVSGLPFTSASSHFAVGPVMYRNINNSAMTDLTSYIASSDAYFNLYMSKNNGGLWELLQYADFDSGLGDLYISFSYYV